MDNFNALSNDIDIFKLLKMAQHETFSKLNVMRIGVIDEVLENNEVRCSITNKKLMQTNTDGTPVWRNYPPVFAKVWYMGSGESGIDYPLATGTPCLLLFNDREFNSYFTSGQVSPLADTLMHSLTYAMAIPLYQPVVDGDFNIFTEGDLVISADTIRLQASEIYLNGALYINGQLYDNHTHTTTTAGNPTSGVNPP